MRSPHGMRRIAAGVYARTVVITAFDGLEITEVRRVQLRGSPAGESRAKTAAKQIFRLAADYGVSNLVVEPRIELVRQLAELRADPLVLDLRTAKRLIFPHHARIASNRQLYELVLRRYPNLARFVTRFARTNTLALSQRWRIGLLRSVAIGMATQHRLVQPSRTSFYPSITT